MTLETLDPYVRGYAIPLAIASILDETVPNELRAILRDEHMLVDSRVNAARSLGAEEPTAKTFLINLVADKNADNFDRRDAASALREFNLTPDDLEALKSLLFDQRPEIFWGGPALAAEEIAKIDTDAAREALTQALDVWRHSTKDGAEYIVDQLERTWDPVGQDESLECALFKSEPGAAVVWRMRDLMITFFKQDPNRAEVLFLQGLASYKEDGLLGGTRAWGIATAMLRLPPRPALIAGLIKLGLKVKHWDESTWGILGEIWERRDLSPEVRKLFYVE